MRALPRVSSSPPPELDLDRVPRRTLISHGGIKIAYWVVGEGPKTLLLANGLGGRLYAWEPMVRALLPSYRLITWDYRGLFESSSPERRRHMSIPDHAEDARAILDAEGVERAVVCGWSMGVQVGLELATLHPSRVAGLILLNGTYGHAFQSGFQPIVPLPFVGRWSHRIVELLLDHPGHTDALAFVSRRAVAPLLTLLFRIFSEMPPERARPLLDRYQKDVFSESNFVNFLRLFQELDAHSAYHHLKEIAAPTLIVSGLFDLLTPAYQSRAMGRRMPNSETLHLRRASHFVLLERPEVVQPAIERFLACRAKW